MFEGGKTFGYERSRILDVQLFGLLQHGHGWRDVGRNTADWINVVARDDNFIRKTWWAQVLVPANVYLILTIVYWRWFGGSRGGSRQSHSANPYRRPTRTSSKNLPTSQSPDCWMLNVGRAKATKRWQARMARASWKFDNFTRQKFYILSFIWVLKSENLKSRLGKDKLQKTKHYLHITAAAVSKHIWYFVEGKKCTCQHE